jgi:hypothetical protein
MENTRNESAKTRLPECLWRSLKVSSAMPDLSRSPRPSAIVRSYYSLVARERQIETEFTREFTPKIVRDFIAREPVCPCPPTALHYEREHLETRDHATAEKVIWRQDHPRRPLPGWLKTRASAVLLYRAR